MTERAGGDGFLAGLGWSDFFKDQLQPDDAGFLPMRIATVHRTRMTGMTQSGPIKLRLPPHTNTANYAVGDWVLVDPTTQLLHRRLTRKTLLERHTAGQTTPQLIAANIDTLFIVTSCNDDFSPARLERYLALANEADINPVIVLTKADTVTDATEYEAHAKELQRGLNVVTLNAKTANAAEALSQWCGAGQTVALVGSSGVGKSTLLNTLAGSQQDMPQLTGGVRETDAKGRHTTTARSLHAIAGGGWAIDTPGMRTLHVSDIAAGLDTLFAEITELAPHCKFRDCTHTHEPGCAVRAAVAAGELDGDRLARWMKLQDESRENAPAQTGPGKRR